MKNKIIAERLKSARKMAGFSMDELVDKANNVVSKNAISKYEKGDILPSSNVLISLAKALSVKVDYFFRSVNFQLMDIEYRSKTSKLLKTDKARVEALIKDNVERLVELENIMNANSKFILPIIQEDSKISEQSEIEVLTEKLRKVWNIGIDPIGSVVDLLENRGLKLIEIDVDIESFDGLSAKIDGYNLIAFNKNFESERKRFTILHELGHLIMEFDEEISPKELEMSCHRFASAFLMPRESFVSEFGESRKSLSLGELIRLKSYFGVSIQAIIYRAFDLGLIEEDLKKRFYIVWNKRGYKINEPGEKYPISEIPTRFNQLLQRAVVEEVITYDKASVLSNKSIDEIHKLVNPLLQ